MSKKTTQVGASEVTNLTPSQAIRAWCIDSVCNSSMEASRCSHTDRPLLYYPFEKTHNHEGLTKGKRQNDL